MTGPARLLLQLLWFGPRSAVLLWAAFILATGASTARDPAALDSEPQPHFAIERVFGGTFVLLSLSWIAGPHIARRGFRKAALVMLLVFPVLSFAIWAVGPLSPLVSWRRWILFGLVLVIPSVMTVAEILWNPNPLRLRRLLEWRNSDPVVLNLD